MNPIFYETKYSGKIGKSTCIYLNHVWGLKIGDLVNLTVYRLDDPEQRTFHATRRVCASGTGVVLFFDKIWGIKPKEMVTISIQKLDLGTEEN